MMNNANATERLNREVEIASIILDQMGGRKFQVMTGAKTLIALDSTKGNPGVRFTLPARFAKDGIRFVTVELTPADDYTMRFQTTAGRVVREVEMVYCDQLREVFTSTTGLETSLGTMGRA